MPRKTRLEATTSLATARSAAVDPLCSETEAASQLGWSPKTLQRRRWLGLPPAFVKVGRSVRYRQSVIDAFVAAGEVQVDSQPPVAA